MKFLYESDPWIGRFADDRQRYRLDKRIGAGGMGDVFLAMDTLLGQQVALKLLKSTLVTSVELRKRFEREVVVSAALKNDHIVQVSDYGVSPEGHPFYVMEYLRGQSLGQLMRRQGRLTVEGTISIITQVCDGLHLAHQGVTLWRNNATVSEHIQVVHRDLKPDNIFLVSTVLGELVKILDFGIAKIREDTAEHTQLTNTFLGTYHYAAPEQLEVSIDIDGRADIYSLGIILYEMLSGTDPFGFGLNTRKISEISWAMAHVTKEPQPLRSQPGLSQLQPELEAVVMRCLQKSPDQRFDSVNQFKQALQSAVAVQPDLTPQQTTTSMSSFENSIVVRTPTPPPSQIPTPNASVSPPPSQQSSNKSTVRRPLVPIEQELPEAILALEQESLLEIIAEIIGPIASTLIQEVSVYAPDIKELVENLMLYLSEQQRTEFEKKAISLYRKVTANTEPKPTHSPTSNNEGIDPTFLLKCKECLADLIGPIANSLIQEVLQSHAQVSPTEFVNLLAGQIPDPKIAREFSQRFLELQS